MLNRQKQTNMYICINVPKVDIVVILKWTAFAIVLRSKHYNIIIHTAFCGIDILTSV